LNSLSIFRVPRGCANCPPRRARRLLADFRRNAKGFVNSLFVFARAIFAPADAGDPASRRRLGRRIGSFYPRIVAAGGIAMARKTASAAAPIAVEPAIWIYDFRDLPGLPDGPVAAAAMNGRHLRVAAVLADILAFYRDALGWDSHDGRGGRVAVCLDTTRAGGWSDPWLGYLGLSGPKTFAGNDGRLYRFDDFAVAADYVAHEFQHLVTHAAAGLGYGAMEQTALNESLSDCMAVAFRVWRDRRADPAASIDWRFGAGVALAPLSCTRNLADPGDPLAWTRAVGHWSQAGEAADGYGLAGVPSRAFQLATTHLGGDILRVAKLWFAALRDPRMKAVRTIPAFADLVCATAAKDGGALEALTKAWASVGLPTSQPLRV